MSPALERILTVIATAMLATGAQYFGLTAPAQKENAGRSVAQSECCPIARECVSGLVR